jgi:hypothetical protein
VIKVCSAESELGEEDEAGAGKGWRAAYALLMSYVLEDFRCLREGRKLNDHLYTVRTYYPTRHGRPIRYLNKIAVLNT